MKRRDFFVNAILFPIVAGKAIGIETKEGKREEKRNEMEELREILYNSPHLFHFRAVDGHFMFVWLDGKECSGKVVEVVAYPHPNKEMRGAVRMAIEDNNIKVGKIITEWKVGMVLWKPRV